MLKVAAARALERDAADEAIRCIEALPHADHDQNDEMVLCQAELALGRSRQALNRARTIEISAEDPKLAVAAASLRILAASELGPAELEAELVEVLPRYQEAPSLLALAAERMASEDPRHQEFLDAAADGAPALTDDFEKDRVARLLFAAGRFAEAADLLVGLHGDTVNTPQLRLRLRALLQAERRAEARDSFERLAPRLRNDTPAITRLGSWIYEELGRLRDARRLIERVLASGQGQLRDRLHWIALCERIPDVDSAKAFLRDLDPSVAGSPEELMVLAQAVDRLIDDPRKALELGYRALRAGYDIAEIHLAYIGGLVFMGRAGRLGMPTHSKIEPDSAVVMKSDVRGEIVRIIETSPDPDITRNEIAADDPFAQRLLGKVVGDEIEMEAVGIGRHTARILEIRSKYLEAHFRALADFERMFPEHRALGSIKMRNEATEEDLKPVFAMARRRADAAAQIRQIYGRGVAPIPLLAAMGGGSALDLWDDLLARPDVRLLASLGVAGESVPAIDALRAGERALLIDPVTLYALSRLGIADQAVAAVPGLCIARSGIDMLMAARREREIHQGEKSGSLVADGDGFRFVDTTQAQIDAAIAAVDATLALARALPVIAPERASELHPETQELLASADTHVLNTLRAAKERGAILLTDDLALRRLAQVEDVLSVWTQPLLAEARRTAQISQAAYVEAVLVLIDAGYHYVSLDASILFEEWRRDGSKVGVRLAALIDHLADPDNEPGSVAGVLSELLLLAFSGEPEPQHISCLLERIAARLRAHLGDERTASLLARAREGVIDFHLLSTRRRRLPARLLASTSLRSVASLADELEAEVNREFDRTYGRLIDAAIGT